MLCLSLLLTTVVILFLTGTPVQTSPHSRAQKVEDLNFPSILSSSSSNQPDSTEDWLRSSESGKITEWRPFPLRTQQSDEPSFHRTFRQQHSGDQHPIRHSKHRNPPAHPSFVGEPKASWPFGLQPSRVKVLQSGDSVSGSSGSQGRRTAAEPNRMFPQFPGSSGLWNSGGDTLDNECPMKNGKKYMPCPSKSRRKFTVCIADEELCDGRPQCPNKEDEDPTSCLFYKTFHKYFTVVMGTLTELSELMASHAEL